MKRKRKLLSLISALAIPLILSGCVNRKSEEKKLAKALEERYGEEFVVVDSIVTGGNWLTAGPLSAVCYPKSDRDLLFKADYSIANQYIYDDGYIQAIVREEAYEEMEEIISDYYTDFLIDVNVFQPIIEYAEREKYPEFVNITDVSIASYEEKYGEKMRLSFYIIFNDTEVEKYDEVSHIFEKYSEKFNNAELNFWCYYTDSGKIAELRAEEEKDIWGNHILRFETNRSEVPEYLYCFENKVFSLHWISDTEGLKKYDTKGILISESEE